VKFWLAVGAFAAFLVAMAAAAVPQLDDWYQLGWLREHGGFSWANVLAFARYNYGNYNPRLGETLLMLLDGPALLRCVIVPAAELLLPCVLFALAHGAWPRATGRDLGRLAVIQALVWLAIPVAGAIYFYRPFTANYLIASTLQLGLAVPYRLAAGAGSPRRWWLAPVMLACGVVAGMTNEHTGPTAIAALVVWCAWAWRAGRLRPWMVCGAIGLAVGFAALFVAPGQAVRYAGVPTQNHPLHLLAMRGFDVLHIVGTFLVEIAPAAAAALALALWAVAREPGRLAALDRRFAVRAAAPVIAAMSIIVTLFASPVVEDRVMFASALLVVVGLAVLVDAVAVAGSVVARVAVAAAAVVVVLHVAAFAWTYRDVVERTDDRVAALDGAQLRGEPAVPLANAFRGHWEYGEDFTFAYMREYVAHHVYGLSGIDVADAPSWSQPQPPEPVHIDATFDPPIALAQAVPEFALARDVPAQWQWVLRELRESWAALTSVPGHALVEVDAIVTPTQPLPGDLPAYLARWRDGKWQLAAGSQRNDALAWPMLVIDTATLPASLADAHGRAAYVQACGTTTTADITIGAAPTGGDELRVPLRYRCRGNHTVYLCGDRECWLAWRFW
jgi:hypothetical protein